MMQWPFATASKDMEIQGFKQALHLMQERLEKAEATIASENNRNGKDKCLIFTLNFPIVLR